MIFLRFFTLKLVSPEFVFGFCYGFFQYHFKQLLNIVIPILGDFKCSRYFSFVVMGFFLRLISLLFNSYYGACF
jgi:hypothetical protein